VDQLLDQGFQAEVETLVAECPRARQTLLFSATMTPKASASSPFPPTVRGVCGTGLGAEFGGGWGGVHAG
jgi:hypothetical protein